MKNKLKLRSTVISAAFCTELFMAATASAQFFDNFEGPSLNPFWSKSEQSGLVVFPGTTRAHNGSQSVELSTTNSPLEKLVYIYHEFPAPTYGVASVWIYDTGAFVYSANYMIFALDGVERVAQLFTYDYNLGFTNGGTYHFNLNGGQVDKATEIPRTEGWHLFAISSLSNSLTLSVDGTLVYTGPGGQPFDHVFLELGGPSGRPAWTAQFDDFQFVAEPANPGLRIQMYPGITITGTVGATYQIQYSADLSNPTNWSTLTNITLPTTPHLFFDTSSAGQPRRFYRALVSP